ncbi:MAG: site-2 protease family protein [Chloroflexi bacterium]|nr:site-2 protease family protein [Chloroflexota bacterium]
MITILIGLVALSAIVIAHELGHYFTAKASGVRVEEFGIGLPPRLFGKKIGDTVYSINAIPFGGFNKLTGEEDPKEPRSLAGKSIGTRFLVLGAGSVMNLLLAFVLFSVTFMIPHDVATGQITVTDVAPNSPAALGGIRVGDIIVSVNGQPVATQLDLLSRIQSNLGKEIAVLIRHSDATEETIRVTPRWNPPRGEGATGIVTSIENPTIVSQSYPIWKAIPLGAARFADTVGLWVKGLVSVFSGKVAATFYGPVGLVQITGEIGRTGIAPLLEIAALISLIIGICNLFPLPALDGGRMTFVFLEWVRHGKRVPPKVEGMIHLIGIALLILFMLVITYQDILRIINGESLIP